MNDFFVPTDSFDLRDYDLGSDGPRYICAPKWEHCFYDRKSKPRDIRWVFNRRNWRLVYLQILDVGSRDWADATPEEASEVELDLIENDARFLDELEEWGLLASSDLPSWTTNASKQAEHPPVPWEDLPFAKAKSEKPPIEQAMSNVVWLSDYRRPSGSS